LGGVLLTGEGKKVHTKIVCTIGPASWSYDGMMGLLKAGMICARLNFSHGDHEGHQKVVDTFRQVVKDSGRQCALMLDTKVCHSLPSVGSGVR
jgi:pyruvate kinase